MREYQPTALEQLMEKQAEAFAREARYPVRPWAVMAPEQLEAARAVAASRDLSRAGLGSWRRETARQLTPEQLATLRANAGIGNP